LEAFKPGTAPPDSYQCIGDCGAAAATPASDQSVGSGTGGLY